MVGTSRSTRGFSALLLAVGLSACAGRMPAPSQNPDWQRYGDVMRGRMPCRSCEPTWDRYGRVMRGENPCTSCGRTGDACSCRPACPTPPPCPATESAAMPPEAKPGEAWCRVYVPAQYETVTEQVTSVCATKRELWVPPVYESRVKRVLVEPERVETIELDGVTRSVETCEVACPARTEVVCRTERDACGCPKTVSETVTVPATTRTSLHDVCIAPPTKVTLRHPAVYSAELCEVEVKPGRWVTEDVPPVVETVTHRVCRSPERWEWRRNPTCEVPVPPATAPCAPSTPATAPAK